MKLHEYLQLPGALTAAELCARAGIKNPDQLRQWRHEYDGRRPGPEYCVAIERATHGQVSRVDLRPGDFWLIWPDLPAPQKEAA